MLPVKDTDSVSGAETDVKPAGVHAPENGDEGLIKGGAKLNRAKSLITKALAVLQFQENVAFFLATLKIYSY